MASYNSHMINMAVSYVMDKYRAIGYESGAIDMIKVAGLFNIKVVYEKFEDYRVGAYFDTDTNTIHVNDMIVPNCRHALVAHELGHYIMHKDWVFSENYVPSYLFYDTEDLKIESLTIHKDKEADLFCDRLLLPRDVFKTLTHLSTIKISSLFKVPVGLVGKRNNSNKYA